LYDPHIFHIKLFNEAAKKDEFEDYLDRFVYSYEGQEEYQQMIGPESEKLMRTPSSSLIEPFRKYILPEGELEVAA
jgi:hypothetical protein